MTTHGPCQAPLLSTWTILSDEKNAFKNNEFAINYLRTIEIYFGGGLMPQDYNLHKIIYYKFCILFEA
ncbi:CLUMA_CG005104, isoform A [Clunio marinus]|uniref:CLUMA_CG005104, isoform A n=1 Tax=Clunio marinus TaxID=568069 RepID=A0A1J1HTN5_9DIPT|nr:CLUMA_CG005104, isoform A [Clunio marinus]